MRNLCSVLVAAMASIVGCIVVPGKRANNFSKCRQLVAWRCKGTLRPYGNDIIVGKGSCQVDTWRLIRGGSKPIAEIHVSFTQSHQVEDSQTPFNSSSVTYGFRAALGLGESSMPHSAAGLDSEVEDTERSMRVGDWADSLTLCSGGPGSALKNLVEEISDPNLL